MNIFGLTITRSSRAEALENERAQALNEWMALFRRPEPNARLVAAAPNLLEALKLVITIGDADLNDWLGTDEVNTIHAAIRKATG